MVNKFPTPPRFPCLQEYLGLEKIIWLWKGVAGDDSVVNGEGQGWCLGGTLGKRQ